MVVTDDSFPRSATFCGTKERNLAPQRNPTARGAVPNSREPQRETDICSTTNANLEELPILVECREGHLCKAFLKVLARRRQGCDISI